MSDPKTQNEPSMEEILASIRRIISEDGSEPTLDRPDPQPPQSSADSDVLVLTEMVAEDGSVVKVGGSAPRPTAPAPNLSAAGPSLSALSTPRLDPVEEEEPAPVAPPRSRASASRPAARSPEPQPVETEAETGLLSPRTAQATAAAFAQLSTAIPRGAGQGTMLEDFVRQALEPMLRQWLDTNLPGIIERLVKDEIERVVDRAGSKRL